MRQRAPKPPLPGVCGAPHPVEPDVSCGLDAGHEAEFAVHKRCVPFADPSVKRVDHRTVVVDVWEWDEYGVIDRRGSE